MPQSITFFLPSAEDVQLFRDLDPDAGAHHLRHGEHVWIAQTYLRLTRAGHDVRLSDELPSDGILVFHAKHRRQVLAQRGRLGSTWLVAVRADSSSPLIADFEIVQNRRFADEKRRIFVPHWPQPSLIPRDPARGERLERVAFKGFSNNLNPAFLENDWSRWLNERGIQWQNDSVEFERDGDRSFAVDWSDYREVDVVLAVRPDDKAMHPSKPPTKLFNAWHAGVPSILGPELAFRELRLSPLDYLEVSSLAEAQSAIARLQEEPGLYRDMVEHGRERAKEFTFERTCARWWELLSEELPRLMKAPAVRRWRHVPLPARRWAGKLRRLVSPVRER